ncbi:MAG: DUF1326 domain-containing protein [Chloroflexi bacterium]|nr:DUF1326 domain-containing protein [Chloroflexota bacterium]
MTTVESWRMRGDVMDACSCSYACPCNFGNDPSKGFCESVVTFRIQEGNYGATQLDGLNLVLLIRFPGNAFAGNWTLGTYLDQRANPEQMQALRTIVSGQAGGLFAVMGDLTETALPTKQVAIDFETVDGEHRITVPGLLEVGSERIPSPFPEEPPLDASISSSVVPFYTGAVKVRRTTVLKLTDPDISFEHSGLAATVGQFDLSGP